MKLYLKNKLFLFFICSFISIPAFAAYRLGEFVSILRSDGSRNDAQITEIVGDAITVSWLQEGSPADKTVLSDVIMPPLNKNHPVLNATQSLF